jgi:hypothetical protein
MRETRLSGSEGGGTEFNRFSLPLSSLIFFVNYNGITDVSANALILGYSWVSGSTRHSHL